MFDLNLTFAAIGDGVETVSEKYLELSGGHVENSSTSNSSVVNVDTSSTAGDDDSCSNHRFDGYAFSFGILKSGGGREESEYEKRENRAGLVTKELFPISGGGSGEVAAASAAYQQQWLDLSANYGGLGEQRIISQPPQQRQQVKKSRRGPRSRSSQYRGVTFYRRTGRWESHIWDCGKQVYLVCRGI